MKRLILLFVVALLSGCGYKQSLSYITVTPATATLRGAGAQEQFAATGFYVHSYANKDITALVTWAADNQSASFHAVCSNSHQTLCNADADCGSGNTCAIVPGLLTAGSTCGTVTVSATYNTGSSSIMRTYATASVQTAAGSCP